MYTFYVDNTKNINIYILDYINQKYSKLSMRAYSTAEMRKTEISVTVNFWLTVIFTNSLTKK